MEKYAIQEGYIEELSKIFYLDNLQIIDTIS